MAGDYWIPYGFNPWAASFRSYEQDRHLITFGPTRSGKGATVIIPALLLAPHSIVCIDPKAQNAAVTARRRREMGQDVHLLNPFNELGLGTSRLNPLGHLKIDHPNVVADARSLADALIIGSPKDPHFTDSAVDLLHAIILHLVDTQPGGATLPEMRRRLTLPTAAPQGETFGHLVAEMLLSDHAFIRQAAGRFMNFESREIQSVISTAITQTFFLDDPNIAHVLGGSDFSMADLKRKPTTVYLILPGTYLDAYSRFFRLLVTAGIDQLTNVRGGVPTLFILDEFATLNNLTAISKAFGFAAGYRVQMWPFLQDLPQLKAIYGERWESFLANAGLIQFFTPNDMTTARYMEDRGGKNTRIRKSASKQEITPEQAEKGLTGWSTQFTQEQKSILAPNETMGLASYLQLIFAAGVEGAVVEQRIPYWQIRRLKDTFDPDPFHPEPYRGEYVEDVFNRPPPPEPPDNSSMRRLGRFIGRLKRAVIG